MFVTTRHLRRVVLALSLIAVFAAAAPTANADPARLSTVHVVAISDSVDTDIGIKVAEDAHNFVALFKKTFVNAGRSSQLQTRVVLGDEVTPDRILEILAKLHVKPDDTLVVLYSGHGGTQMNHEQVLCFDHGRYIMPRQRLVDAVKAKNARLTVLLTDACSGYQRGSGIAVKPTVPTYEPRAVAVGSTMEWSVLNSLFLSHTGLVDITAAEPGYNAATDLNKSGSLFTNALLHVLKTPYGELVRQLDRDGDGDMQWDEVLPQLRSLAAQYHRSQNPLVERAQQAFAKSLGRWTPAAVGR